MTEFKREWFKDEVIGKLFEAIKKQHKVADHTTRVLYENRNIKDFCEQARHFVVLGGNTKPLYIHYDVASWFHNLNGALVSIESIGVYDDFMEYETARMRGLHSGAKADIPNIN